MTNVAFIGAGSMAEALFSGWLQHDVFLPGELWVSNRSNKERLQQLHTQYGVNIIDDLSILNKMDIIILAIKPKDVQKALAAIQPHIHKDCAVLSVLAGISIQTIQNYVGDRPIARAMPNTSATIGLSASGISFNEHFSHDLKAMFMQMLHAIGIVIEVEEDKLHAITAFSGSGPAYIYYLIEAFEKNAANYGLDEHIVRKLMMQTITGAIEMLQTTKEEPAVLRKKVTSPGGTTEAGIQALQKYQFTEAIEHCIKNAEQRSRQLATELE